MTTLVHTANTTLKPTLEPQAGPALDQFVSQLEATGWNVYATAKAAYDFAHDLLQHDGLSIEQSVKAMTADHVRNTSVTDMPAAATSMLICAALSVADHSLLTSTQLIEEAMTLLSDRYHCDW